MWVAVVAVVAHGFDRTALLPCVLLAAATLAGPGLAWACVAAPRADRPGPTGWRRSGACASWRPAAAGRGCWEPVAAELLRYRQVREQYAIAAGAVDSAAEERPVDPWIGSQAAAAVGAQGSAAVAGGPVGVDGPGAGAFAGGRGSSGTGGRGGPGGPGGSGDLVASDVAGRETGVGAGTGTGTDAAASPTGVTELCTTSE